MKNLDCRLNIIRKQVLSLFLAFVLFPSVFAQAPEISLKASKTSGNPGDKITFVWNFADTGNSITLTKIRFDGVMVDWKSPHTWIATPGTHVIHAEARWGNGKADDFPYVIKDVAIEISGWEGHFNHPGIYNSQEELDIIKSNVNSTAPHAMKEGWKEMLSSTSTSVTGRVKYTSLDWQPHAMEIVYPKEEGKQRFFDDGQAAYAHALQWVVTGKQEYANKAIEIYNAWSYLFKDMITKNGDVYKNLFSSWNANNWVAGAEIIRHYNNGAAGWKKTDIAKFEEMCKVFERLMLEWKGSSSSYGGGQNQDVGIARTRMALGVFLNDQALFDQGTYLLFELQYDDKGVVKRHGHVVNLVGTTVASNGEIMELNRDAGHGTGSFNSLANAAEILRHQNVPDKYKLYNYFLDDDTIPRLLKGSEFLANSYVHSPSPITDNKNFTNKHKGIRYPEMILNYYKYLSPKKYNLTKTEEVIELVRPMVANPYDIGWSTVTHANLSELFAK
jgi:hypothetical protein